MNTTSKEFYLTKDGVEKLKAELENLVKNERPKIAGELKEAKEYGDLSENASWDAAKDHQSFIEGRISEIEHILRNAAVIESPKKKDKIDIGSTVHLEVEDGKQIYTIVGSQEANPEEGKISNESPIGRALMGKTKGEEVSIDVPSGEMVYKIKHIE
ncbi:MAG TPA: transcription elongation factor GreA [Candidatus Saccharimonadales bacterium]|nr:transcription elongation factor GreA [Candidatus Saccharimonadales bacterium]